jgi:site-specific DNA-methyltransferase (adenine-specific)
MEVSPPAALYQGDAVAWLRSLLAASVDLVVTDPPYESLERHRAIGTTTRLERSQGSSNIWFDIFPNSRFAELFAQVHRVLKADRHFYLFSQRSDPLCRAPAGSLRPQRRAISSRFPSGQAPLGGPQPLTLAPRARVSR